MCLAQHYRIEEKDNCFSLIRLQYRFLKVVQNIYSFEKHGRTMDLILYYPDRDIWIFLIPVLRLEGLVFVVSKGSNDKDKFVIYRLDNGGFKD